MFRKVQHIHFVGIGGAGMSGIAEVLLTLSYHVTGSDLHESESVRRIRALGGTVFIGHAASHIGNAQVVVVSSAVPPTNPEVVAAKARVIPVIPRAEMLAALLPRVTKRYQTYGLTPSADLVGTDVQLHVGVAEFSARLRGEPLGRFKVAMPGIHNVRNALAAIAVGLELGVTLPHIDQALAGFKGVERRFPTAGAKSCGLW